MRMTRSIRHTTAALAVAGSLVGLNQAGAVAAPAVVGPAQASSTEMLVCPGGWATVFRVNIQGSWFLEGVRSGGARCAMVYNPTGNAGDIVLEYRGSARSDTIRVHSSAQEVAFSADWQSIDVRARVNGKAWTAWKSLK